MLDSLREMASDAAVDGPEEGASHPQSRGCSLRAQPPENRVKTMAERFWAKVDKSGDCWLWTGGLASKGYGQVWVGFGKKCLAHRVAWELTHGTLPAHESYHGICVLHRCDNPRCVRPSHLFVGTIGDNIRDMHRKGRFKVWDRNRRTHCRRGHLYTPETSMPSSPSGGRQCRTCKNQRDRASRKRRRLQRLGESQ
jgi:hypothetical protein